MMRRAVLTAALVILVLAARAVAQQTPIELVGTFAMRGMVTVADHVRGEHRGELVQRTWVFKSCGQPPCGLVALFRLRGGRNVLDTVALRRKGPARYSGRARFWVALYCAHRLRVHGGWANERINVQVLHAALVDGIWYATAIRAWYVNRKRVNRTRCPGGIGHDAARYTGTLTSPLPGTPSARS